MANVVAIQHLPLLSMALSAWYYPKQVRFSSTLIRGLNAVSKPLPLHIMYSFKAENEENFQVRADWLVELLLVVVQFGRKQAENYVRHLP